MTMRVNENTIPWMPGLTVAALRARIKPQADVVILNGHPLDEPAWGSEVAPHDVVVLIRRGETLDPTAARALLHARHTPGVAQALERATVGIAGAGGLGSHVAQALARSGVGRLILADFDVVEPSNLNRQLYRVLDIGRIKVEALAQELKQIAPTTQVVSHVVELTAENMADAFGLCDVLVECLDRPEAKRMLVETALLRLPQTKVVAASGLAGLDSGNRIRTRKLSGTLWLVGDETSAAQPGRGLMAPRVMVTAGHQALTVVRLLLGEED